MTDDHQENKTRPKWETPSMEIIDSTKVIAGGGAVDDEDFTAAAS